MIAWISTKWIGISILEIRSDRHIKQQQGEDKQGWTDEIKSSPAPPASALSSCELMRLPCLACHSRGCPNHHVCHI